LSSVSSLRVVVKPVPIFSILQLTDLKVMYCIHRSTTSAVRLTNALVKASAFGGGMRGIRTSVLRLSAAPTTSMTATSVLDEIVPEIADFPARHIGPRKHDAKVMLAELGYEVMDPNGPARFMTE